MRKIKEDGEKNILGIVFACSKNKKAKVKAVGKTLDLLTLLVAISEYLAERISKERNIDMKSSEKFIIDCISDGIKTIK